MTIENNVIETREEETFYKTNYKWTVTGKKIQIDCSL